MLSPEKKKKLLWEIGPNHGRERGLSCGLKEVRKKKYLTTPSRENTYRGPVVETAW